jgi:hypothetical protein
VGSSGRDGAGSVQQQHAHLRARFRQAEVPARPSSRASRWGQWHAWAHWGGGRVLGLVANFSQSVLFNSSAAFFVKQRWVQRGCACSQGSLPPPACHRPPCTYTALPLGGL